MKIIFAHQSVAGQTLRKMFSLLISILVCLSAFQAHASKVFVNTPYELEDASFMIFERYDTYMVLNEYPAFRSENQLQKESPIFDEKNVVLGQIIGSHDNYYPITPLKSDLHCGNYNVRELAGINRTINYRFYWWENIDDFNADMEEPMNNLNGPICFVYV